jgi:hypothetical protein
VEEKFGCTEYCGSIAVFACVEAGIWLTGHGFLGASETEAGIV